MSDAELISERIYKHTCCNCGGTSLTIERNMPDDWDYIHIQSRGKIIPSLWHHYNFCEKCVPFFTEKPKESFLSFLFKNFWNTAGKK